MKNILAGLAAVIALSVIAPVQAQERYPSRVVKIVVGFPPGSSADILGRVYAQHLTDHLGQQFIVENKPGASSNIATESVARAEPDGYTIVIGSVANTISASTMNLKYSFSDDLAPIAAFASGPNLLMVSASLGVSNVKEFIDYVKARPGKISFGSSGTWSGPHLAGELFGQVTGAMMTFVPYQGVPAAISDLLGGHIPVVVATAPTAASYVGDDRVRLLAVTSAKRSKLVPDVPTMQEAGLAGFDTAIWYGFFAPKGTPTPILKTLADAVMTVNETPAVKEALLRNGTDPLSYTLDDFGKFVREDLQRWKQVTDVVKASMK